MSNSKPSFAKSVSYSFLPCKKFIANFTILPNFVTSIKSLEPPEHAQPSFLGFSSSCNFGFLGIGLRLNPNISSTNTSCLAVPVH